MLQHVDPKWTSAVKRAIRSFVGAFIAVYGIPQILDALAGSAPVDVNALRSAAVAGFAAVVALLWRAFIDPIPAPTLSDTQSVDGTG